MRLRYWAILLLLFAILALPFYLYEDGRWKRLLGSQMHGDELWLTVFAILWSMFATVTLQIGL
ncbi:MAG TPA: hypothetical protein VJI13_05220 [Candidatus Norongarragalinales archaeon]|nr:hypothetical protein [Candidatus Norongarragalinales archaeon]